jgi:hypothetical protein
MAVAHKLLIILNFPTIWKQEEKFQMKKDFLSKEEYEELRRSHCTEKDGRTRDRIKAVLLSHRGWTYKKIPEALFGRRKPSASSLNPIERLWKVTNEYVRNNRYFRTVREFKHDIMAFFWNTWNYIAEKMRSRINDNFHILKKSNFLA